jgi:hypothetical protein
MLQLSGRLSASEKPRLTKIVSARRGQEHQDCVCRSEVKAARDCITNQRLRLPVLSTNQRPMSKDCISKKRPGLPGLCLPNRGQGCAGLCHQSDTTTVRETVRRSEAKAAHRVATPIPPSYTRGKAGRNHFERGNFADFPIGFPIVFKNHRYGGVWFYLLVLCVQIKFN